MDPSLRVSCGLIGILVKCKTAVLNPTSASLDVRDAFPLSAFVLHRITYLFGAECISSTHRSVAQRKYFQLQHLPSATRDCSTLKKKLNELDVVAEHDT